MRALYELLRAPLRHVAVFSLCMNLLLLAPTLFMLQVFDRVLVSRSTDTLLALLLGAGVALWMYFGLDLLRQRMQAVMGQAAGDALTPLALQALMVEGSQGRPPSEGLRDVATLRTAMASPAVVALFDAPWLVFYLALITAVHPMLGLTAFLAALLMAGLTLASHLATRHQMPAVQEASGTAARFLDRCLAQAEAAQALGMVPALLARWRTRLDQVLALQGPLTRRTSLAAAAGRTLRQAVQVVMLAVGAWLVLGGHASPGATLACTILLGRALAPVELLIAQWKVLADARAAAARLAKLLETQDPEAAMALPAPRGELQVQQLTWRIPGSERLGLAGVSLALAPGEVLAVVGPSGAGKSTLMRVLTGLWKPSAGQVRLDGSDLAQWPREQLGPWLGYLPQEVALFPGTVAENIARLGEVDSEAVVVAARRAGAHEMILALPQGYDTPVVPGSPLPSPGQRQRIGLARALYGDPRLVLLDEPNANLDGEGEQALAEALKALRGQVTTVVVTHRSQLLQQVDKLLVLEGGRATQFGPVAEVLRAMQQRSAATPNVVAMPVGGAPAAPAASPTPASPPPGAGGAVAPSPAQAAGRLGKEAL